MVVTNGRTFDLLVSQTAKRNHFDGTFNFRRFICFKIKLFIMLFNKVNTVVKYYCVYVQN